jgi:hypothetical protein
MCDVRLEGDDALIKTYAVADVKFDGKLEEEKSNLNDVNFVKESELKGDSPQFAYISEKEQAEVVEEKVETPQQTEQGKKKKKFKKFFKKNAKK